MYSGLLKQITSPRIKTHSMFSLLTWRLSLLLISFYVKAEGLVYCTMAFILNVVLGSFYTINPFTVSLLSQQLRFRHIIPFKILKMTPCLEPSAKLSSLSTSTPISSQFLCCLLCFSSTFRFSVPSTTYSF